MSVFYERSFRVDSLLGYLQEAATEAACALHVSREEMIDKYHVFWMLARMWYRLDRPLFWDDTVTIRTWHRGDKGASMYRDFDLFRDGERVGEAVSVWVLADLDTHKLFRLSNVMEFRDTTGGELCKDKTLGRLRGPVALHPAEERQQCPLCRFCLRRPGHAAAGGGAARVLAPDRLSQGVPAGGEAAPAYRLSGWHPLCPWPGDRGKSQI